MLRFELSALFHGSLRFVTEKVLHVVFSKNTKEVTFESPMSAMILLSNNCVNFFGTIRLFYDRFIIFAKSENHVRLFEVPYPRKESEVIPAGLALPGVYCQFDRYTSLFAAASSCR